MMKAGREGGREIERRREKSERRGTKKKNARKERKRVAGGSAVVLDLARKTSINICLIGV